MLNRVIKAFRCVFTNFKVLVIEPIVTINWNLILQLDFVYISGWNSFNKSTKVYYYVVLIYTYG